MHFCFYYFQEQGSGKQPSSNDSRSLSVGGLSLQEITASESSSERTKSVCGSKSSSSRVDVRQKLQDKKEIETTNLRCNSDSEVSRQSHKQMQDVGHTTKKAYSDKDCETKSSTSRCKKKKKHYTPFWPLYKKWAEIRCYTDYEMVTRHVNQLFIRGDNVVSVSIEDG